MIASMPASLVSLLLMLLACGVLGTALLVAVTAFALLKPPRMTDGKALWIYKRLSPADLGLRFEDVTFTVRDERDGSPLSLAAWWIPHPASNGRCVVMLHDYADAKVGVIAHAPAWHASGFNILALDLRAHGASGGSISAAGYWERHDLSQVLNQLRVQHPHRTQHLVLFGVGLGAITAAATAALREDVDALVMERPFQNYRALAASTLGPVGAQARLLESMSLPLAGWLVGANFNCLNLPTMLAQSRTTMTVIQAGVKVRSGPLAELLKLPAAQECAPEMCEPSPSR